MSESRRPDPPPSTNPPSETTSMTRRTLWPFGVLFSILAPVVVALLLYQLDSFDPAPMPMHEFTRQAVFVPKRNPRLLIGSETIGFGKLLAPEDLAYNPESKLIYTGCSDGWIKRVTVNESAADSVVEDWINTGGRPLGIALNKNEVIIADADEGLLKVTEDGKMELLTKEAEGVEFKLTDGVDIANDGMIYFTDASYKYSLHMFIWDVLEGKPHGRLMSYDPSTNKTKVLVRDLYFANGIAVSPDQNFVVFCETTMGRCKKYYIKGERKGSVGRFIDNLPGMPDNIRYDGEGHYWIGLSTEASFSWNMAMRYPVIRKVLAIMERYIGRPNMEKNGGVLVVDLEGKPTAHYYDLQLSLISSGIKIGDHLYCGSVIYPYIIRLNLTRHPALADI